jgi:hypothetical protein
VVEALKTLARAILKPRFSGFMAVVFMYAYGALVQDSVWWWFGILLGGSIIDGILSVIYDNGAFDPKEDS